MKFYQLQVMLFSVAVGLVIITSFLSSTTAKTWNKKDGMKFTVPRQMAKLLKKITKQNVDQVESMESYEDIQTTLKQMHLNGVRNRELVASDIMRKESEGGSHIKRRQKRSVKTNNVPPTCHSGKVYVNLTKYSNIIAPLGFHTHYCGSTYLLPVGNDAIVQLLSKAIVDAFSSLKKYPSKVLANPSCCVPGKIHGLYVLHTDVSGFHIIRSIPKIIATHCACQND